MSKSRLSHKISLCQLVEKLDENGCMDVIQSIHNELGCDSMNALLQKMLTKFTETSTTDSLVRIQNIMKTRISVANSVNNKHKSSKKKRNESKITSSRKCKNAIAGAANRNLHGIPTDLLTKTALFLNEKDIFKFEQCCRMFYQIINNTTYLTQSSNFKTLVITNKRLDQMANIKHSFYKYSKTQDLQLELITNSTDPHDPLNWGEYWYDLDKQKSKWIKVQQYATKLENWWTNMFKSIKSLKLNRNGTLLLYSLPLDVLFDPNVSNLERLSLDHYWRGYFQDEIWAKYMRKFQQKYLSIKKSHGENTKVLDLVTNSNTGTFSVNINTKQPHHIKSKHIWLNNKVWLKLRNISDNKHLRTLTFEEMVRCNVKSSHSCTSQIETVRLINFCGDYWRSRLFNKQAIQALNLQSSLKNLTLEINFGDDDMCSDDCQKDIVRILQKEDYFNLENVNILLRINSDCDEYKKIDGRVNIDWLFTILKQNWKTLKYQFKQFNIGLYIQKHIWQRSCSLFLGGRVSSEVNRYYVLNWNCEIDDKLLTSYQTKWTQLRQTETESHTNMQKYLALKQQWSN